MAEVLRHGGAARGGAPAPDPGLPAIETKGLSVFAGRRQILRDVELRVDRGEVLALVGPSGAGKSTLLKCLNRLVDLEPSLSVTGQVLFDGEPVYARQVDPDLLRARVGMLFQRPVVFPGSVRKNVLFGVRHGGDPARAVPRRRWPELTERVLREAALWDEVAGRLDEPAATLSIGQQQRLCLARTLALEPEVILMDEPTSALDRTAARKIEELILALAGRRTLVLVTHDPDQARRVATRAACVAVREGAGELLACGPCDTLFGDPGCRGVIGVI